ncbi:chromosome partitioning ATP-binding protein [Legionella wadsworthii]|uniref:Iron-sulfur cluster carrier protein n=1 Tax=Legionella wadsworthii TaxID=28088 RepID=A0A378LQB1_9GAMM|nr:iron-sulfur cluster carrier protein ApbC [Legionella wadsworthii]STY28973.1 chromosome partitioning ATP-binding protein [Legionella wadsworthii]
MTIEDIVIQILSSIKDPFLGLTGKEMNLECRMDITPTQLIIKLTAGFPSQLLEKNYLPLVYKALQSEMTHKEIIIDINQKIKPHKTQLTGKGLRGVKNTIAVASGKGGVGKSTVTVNLAAALAQLGARVGILDADIYGPSMPLMLGEIDPIQVKDERYIPANAHGIQTMSIGYLTDSDQALIWRGPMLAKSLIQILDITLWDELDYLFIDLPPGTGDIQLTLVQKIPLTAAIVVTTPQSVATLDAQKALAMFSKTGIDVLGVVENMSTHICSQCGHEETIFGAGGAEKLCTKSHIPLLGQLPLDARIRQNCDEGIPTAIQPQGALSDTLLKTAMVSSIELSKKPINYADKFPKIVVE